MKTLKHILLTTSTLFAVGCTSYNNVAIGDKPTPHTKSLDTVNVSTNVSHCSLQESIPGHNVSAAFFIVHKRGEAILSLVGAKVPKITSKIDLRKTLKNNGQTAVQNMSSYLLMEGDNWFKKDGNHLALSDIRDPLKVGDIYPLTLLFSDGRTHQCEAVVRLIDELTPHKPTYIYSNGMPYQYLDNVTYIDY